MNEKELSAEIATTESIVANNRLTDLTYKTILAQNPPLNVIKRHKYGNFDYLPITVIERLLDGLFESWSTEILREGQVANGFYTVVRVTAKIPQSEKTLVSDGIGFAEFQTIKGALPTDLSQIIQGAGVMSIPKAKAEAVKNAVKSFGNLFGRNLTRKDDQAGAEAELVSRSRARIASTLKGAKK